jgi:hypothetical protein
MKESTVDRFARLRAFAIAALGIVTFAAAVDADAQGAPKRKPGLWQQSISHSAQGVPPTSMQMCTDEKTDDLIANRAAGNEKQQCTQQSVKREGNAYVVEAVCKDGKTTVRTRGVFSGDFNTRYTGEMRSTFDPPMHGMKEMTQKMEARWVGPCKPGQKPGDVVVEGMGTMNMNQMMGSDPKKMQEMMNDPKKMQEMMQQMQQMQQQMQQKPK